MEKNKNLEGKNSQQSCRDIHAYISTFSHAYISTNTQII